MKTFGRHLLAEYRGCLSARLDDAALVEALMLRGAEAAGATVLGATFHRFSPHGVSGVVVIQESHFSIHTWPESGYAAVDFYTCGECIPEAAHHVLMDGLRAATCELMVIHRGLSQSDGDMSVERHELQDRANACRLPPAGVGVPT